jgi:hypothetical protein
MAQKTNASHLYTTDFVTSKDGTVVGYRQLGSGPGIILVHGGMMASQNLMKLATALCEEVHRVCARPSWTWVKRAAGQDYGLAKECEDLQTLTTRLARRGSSD